MNTFICIAGILIILTSGCTSSRRYPPHASWPNPVAANYLKQFEGVFRNHSFDSQTGKAAENSNELFVFLLGPGHAHANQGDRVEIRAMPDGNELKLRLLGHQNEEIDSATLRCGIDFQLSDGRLILHGPYSGFRSLNSNFGPGLSIQRDQLYVSARGDLLGSTSENSAMLVMMFIPGTSTMKFWMFWPKLAK